MSVFDLSKSLLGKRTAESVDNGPKAIILIISLFDPKDNTEYPVAALMGGDLYPMRDVIKKAPTEECTVNGEVIPMVADCLKAKYISRDLLSQLFRGIPADCKEFMKYLAAHFEVIFFGFSLTIHFSAHLKVILIVFTVTASMDALRSVPRC